MMSSLPGALLLPLRDLRLGPMRISPYGLCAAAGVVSAMWLAGRSARRTGLDAERAWDAGLFAILCCFVASRLLLVMRDPRAFLRYPVLVLSLPSLTIAGMTVAAVAVWAYLRWKRLPLLTVLDAFAAPGALLAAFLELGHWLEQSEIGMPVVRDGHVVGFQPVALYGVVLASALLVLLWRLTGGVRRPGQVAALGLTLGGVAALGLDMLTLPAELFSTLPLEPGEMVALTAATAGAVLWFFGPGEGAGQFPSTPREIGWAGQEEGG